MVDVKDKKILAVLVDNSRLSYREIAKRTKMSVATVMYRVKDLENAGVIKRYTAMFDHDKLGYDMQALINIRVAKGKLFDVEKKIASDPHVSLVLDVTGDFDAVIFAKFKNRKGLDGFVKKIQTYPFVERTQTKLVLNTIKEEQIKVT